jgi:hypothetical protein
VKANNVTGSCAVCGQRVSRYWGVGASYVPHGETGKDGVLSDITVAGFCRTHRDDVIALTKRNIEAKGAIESFMEPTELRDHQLRDFMALAGSIGDGQAPEISTQGPHDGR